MEKRLVTPRRWAMAALSWLAMFASTPALPQPSADPPLTKVRSWTLADDDLRPPRSPPPAYRLRLEMAFLAGSHWAPETILEAAKRAVPILAQCDIEVSAIELHQFDGPQRFRLLSTPDSREFVRRSGLRKPAVFFVDDTLQRPAFDAEAMGRANTRTRPEMADTVWITAAIRDLPIALAHELVHVLANAGDHSDAPGNLMREDTAPGNVHLTPQQCSAIGTSGHANGLLDRSTVHGDGPERRP